MCVPVCACVGMCVCVRARVPPSDSEEGTANTSLFEAHSETCVYWNMFKSRDGGGHRDGALCDPVLGWKNGKQLEAGKGCQGRIPDREIND